MMSGTKDYGELILTYRKQEERLQFTHFSNEDALQLGLLFVDKCKADDLPVAIDITVNGHQLFKYAMAGAAIGNDEWIRRKINVVKWKQTSSLLVGTLLEQAGTDVEKKYAVSKADYAAIGGCFPIRLRGTGVIGTVCVSGLQHEKDHLLVVEVLSAYLGKQQ